MRDNGVRESLTPKLFILISKAVAKETHQHISLDDHWCAASRVCTVHQEKLMLMYLRMWNCLYHRERQSSEMDVLFFVFFVTITCGQSTQRF